MRSFALDNSIINFQPVKHLSSMQLSAKGDEFIQYDIFFYNQIIIKDQFDGINTIKSIINDMF